MNTASLNDTTVQGQICQSCLVSPCKGTCPLVDSACCGSGGVCYRCEARLACTAPLTLSTEIQDLPLDKGKGEGGTKEEEMTTGQEQERMLTLHKLECAEAEQPPWMYCTRSVLDLVGGLLCTLLLHWLLGRENLVLETENRKWCTPPLMSPKRTHNFRLWQVI